MKKIILTSLLCLILSNTINAQIKTIKLKTLVDDGTTTINYMGNYSKIINIDKKDTSYFLSIVFQNMEYEHISDIKHINFNLKTDSLYVTELINVLKSAVDIMDGKETISWNKKKYSVRVYDFNNILYLYEAEGNGYTTLSKGSVYKLMNWLESIING